MQVKSRVIAFQQRVADLPEREPEVSFSHLKGLSDEDLLDQLTRGHHDALALLFDRYYRLVLSVALQILRDRGEAEDLMQEVFFEIYRVVGKFDREKGSAKTWILQYAYHRSLNRRHYLNLRSFYDQQQISELDARDFGWSSDAWNGLTFDELRWVIRQGLATLSEKQKETLELACFQGLLLSEIAARLNESESNVRHYYYRGLKKLRDFLRERALLREKACQGTAGG